jgi:hypothetical protein
MGPQVSNLVFSVLVVVALLGATVGLPLAMVASLAGNFWPSSIMAVVALIALAVVAVLLLRPLSEK